MAQSQSPIALEAFAQGLNANLSTIERNIFDKASLEYSQIAKVDVATKWVTEMLAYQGLSLPVLNRDLQPVPQVTPVQGYKSVIRQSSYRSGIVVEETAIRMLEHKAILDNVDDMLESIKSLKDRVVADVYNNGTSGSLVYSITEADAVARAFFSTGHVYEDNSGTFSNYYNVGVAPTIETVYLIINQYIKRLKDFAGNYITFPNQFTIYTPTLTPAYGLAADEIVESQDRPDTANRATNVLRKSVRLNHVALNNFTSSSRWFIGIPTSHRAFPVLMLQAIDREIDPLGAIGKINPHAYQMTARTQFGVGFNKNYRGVVAIGT